MSFFATLTKATFFPYAVLVDVVTLGHFKVTRLMCGEVDQFFQLRDFIMGEGPEFVRHRAEDGVKTLQERVDALQEAVDAHEEHIAALHMKLLKTEERERKKT